MLLKICGIKSKEDASWALRCGANALGFVFYPKSPRYLNPLEAKKIIHSLTVDCIKVGVFVGSPKVPPPAEIDVLQLHGLKSASEICTFGKKALIAVGPSEIKFFPNDDLLIDTSWGRGITANWKTLKSIQRPFILSGGLTPCNVYEAIQLLHPLGVDVSSGVERSPGLKDPDKIQQFLSNARRAVHEFDLKKED